MERLNFRYMIDDDHHIQADPDSRNKKISNRDLHKQNMRLQQSNERFAEGEETHLNQIKLLSQREYDHISSDGISYIIEGSSFGSIMDSIKLIEDNTFREAASSNYERLNRNQVFDPTYKYSGSNKEHKTGVEKINELFVNLYPDSSMRPHKPGSKKVNAYKIKQDLDFIGSSYNATEKSDKLKQFFMKKSNK